MSNSTEHAQIVASCRAVYAVKLGDDLYVLHAFKKKFKTGKNTPKSETDLVKRRLKQVKEQLRKKA